ncbi:MAG: ferredoxin family protein [Armatimonadetes bacterium]|nr:ferredoxin family protein [Armatimonadota bacterium]
MPYIITEPCIGVKDKSCLTVCPVDCIYEGEEMLYIHPDECIDCGLCEPECPVTAIFVDTDLPDEWEKYTEINAVEGGKLSDKQAE